MIAGEGVMKLSKRDTVKHHGATVIYTLWNTPLIEYNRTTGAISVNSNHDYTHTQLTRRRVKYIVAALEDHNKKW
jgi:hypothetical protein